MKLEDCTPGRKVIMGMVFMPLNLHGFECEVLETRPAPARPEDNPAYPNGMVRVRLPDQAQWSTREPWVDPAHLGWMPGGEE